METNVKTALDYFKDRNASGLACEYGHSVEVVPLVVALEIAKIYAKDVSEATLCKAAGNSSLIHIGDDTRVTRYGGIFKLEKSQVRVDKTSILDTKIDTP